MRSAEGEDAREVMVIQLAEGGTIVPRSQDQTGESVPFHQRILPLGSVPRHIEVSRVVCSDKTRSP